MFSPAYDPLDPIHSVTPTGDFLLTNIELSMTNKCNLRCSHCGVGEMLSDKEIREVPIQTILERLDEIPHLKSLNLTGGEPFFDLDTVRNYIQPILTYAKSRGILTQVNSNLTLDLERYLPVIDLIDVFHISFNYTKYDDFYNIVFAKKDHTINYENGKQLYETLCNNTMKLAERGVFISAETIVSKEQLDNLTTIHNIVSDLGVKRHELQTLFSSGFTSSSRIPSKEQYLHAVNHLVDNLNPDVWLLIGCIPFFECGFDQEYKAFLNKLKNTKNISIRNCPDGRNRLNVNTVNGYVYATDLANISHAGNMLNDSLVDIHSKWQKSEVFSPYNCVCIDKSCTGPCMAVAKIYYPEINFKNAKILD